MSWHLNGRKDKETERDNEREGEGGKRERESKFLQLFHRTGRSDWDNIFKMKSLL